MSKSTKITLETFGYKQELKRVLTTGDLIIYGLVFMVPIAPFGIYGIIAKASNGMVPLTYLLGMIGILFTAFSYWSLAEVFPISGSVYAYTSRGINKEIGFISGWAILLDYLLVPSLLYIVSATALHTLLPFIPTYVLILIFIAINTVINFIGIKATAMFNKIAVVFELIVFVIFVIACVNYINVSGSGYHLRNIFPGSEVNFRAVLTGTSIAVLSFMGFDGISTLSEEARGGSDSIGKASVISVTIIGILFILQSALTAFAWPDFGSFHDIDSAFYEVAERVGGQSIMWICAIATGLAWGVANSLVAQTAISRILYSMSRDAFLPRALAKIHPKYQTPYIAILFIAVLSSMLTYVFTNNIPILSSIVNFGALTSFMIINFTVIYYFLYKKKSKKYIKHLLCPLCGIIVVGCVWSGLSEHAKVFGAIWIAAGILLLLLIKKVFNRNIDLEI
jgi:Amino acid transporters